MKKSVCANEYSRPRTLARTQRTREGASSKYGQSDASQCGVRPGRVPYASKRILAMLPAV
eukprot:1520716-Prymnesium_polylepis.1